jgi:hypothetical protein
MRTRVKSFYRAPWETGFELEDEYRAWLDKYENGQESYGFLLVARQKIGNWLNVWYHAYEKSY